MPQRLHSDVIKGQITNWLENAIHCELFPNGKSSLANAELPQIEKMSAHMASPACGDENHVIALHMADGKVFSVLVKYGDYTNCSVEPSRG